jgi:hypothetical protein
MWVEASTGGPRPFRIVPEVLTSPVLGNYLPASLAEFSSVLAARANLTPAVRKLTFGGPGISSYSPACNVEFLVPAR